MENFNAGEVLQDLFSQDEFNQLLEETIQDERLSFIKTEIGCLGDDDYFFSRFRFISEFIEERF